MSAPAVLDLFCGAVGGWSLGLHRAGFRTVAACEINPWRREVFSRNFPGVVMYDDVRSLTAARLISDLEALPGIVVGSPPCQRTSVAAAIWKQRDGASLWPAMHDLCDDIRPEWIVVEQPPGNAAWEAAVAESLRRSGYHSARVEFAARDLGAPYLGRRVFILASPCRARLEIAWSAVPSEIERIARAAAAGNDWAEGVPGALRVVDRPPYQVDRRQRIEAIGDSFPPAMALVIGRAILSADPALCERAAA